MRIVGAAIFQQILHRTSSKTTQDVYVQGIWSSNQTHWLVPEHRTDRHPDISARPNGETHQHPPPHKELQRSPTPYLKILQLHIPTPEAKIIDHAVYPYRRALGILRYLVASTRPDLAYITNGLERHKQKSNDAQLEKP